MNSGPLPAFFERARDLRRLVRYAVLDELACTSLGFYALRRSGGGTAAEQVEGVEEQAGEGGDGFLSCALSIVVAILGRAACTHSVRTAWYYTSRTIRIQYLWRVE